MQLLVSVRNASEAVAAVEGGADIVDAKEPDAGALGAVSLDVFRAIHGAAATRLVSAAIGDASDEAAIERLAFAYAAAEAAFVKVGFAGVATHARVTALADAARRGAHAGGHAAVVLVAYADETSGVSPSALIDIAARSGARGVLLDTADKHGAGLPTLVDHRSLAAWISIAHDSGLFVALAGRLGPGDVPFARDAGADVVGVRGAACEGGRTGHVTGERVRALRAMCGTAAPAYNAERTAAI